MLQNNCLVEKGLVIKINWASYEIFKVQRVDWKREENCKVRDLQLN